MNRLKGALKLYMENEAIKIILILFAALIAIIADDRMTINGEYFSNYIGALIMLIIIEKFSICFFFWNRFSMLCQFNTSRKLFMKVTAVTIIIKSILFSLIITIGILIERVSALFMEVNYSIDFFGVKYFNPGIIGFICIFFIIFLYIIFVLSLITMIMSFLNAVLGVLVVLLPIITFSSAFLVPKLIEIIGNNIIVLMVVMLLIVANFYVCWKRIKRTSTSYPKILID